MSKKILFFGNERLATGVSTKAPILQALIKSGYQIQAVILSTSSTEQAQSELVAKLATENKIPVLNPSNLRDAKDEIAGFGADAAVLAAYGKIVPQSVLDLFPVGIINIHPSLLPKHRGSTPIESVILDGESATGVSIMQLRKEMDAGPIYAQESIDLSGNESKQDLADKLNDIGSRLLMKNLDDILNLQITPTDQDESLATYDNMIKKDDGVINWDLAGSKILNQIRAYTIWPRSRTTIGKLSIIVTSAHLENITGPVGEIFLQDKKLGFYTQDGVLIIDRLIPESKKEMSSDQFLAGYRDKIVS